MGHAGAITSVCALGGSETALASASDDGSIRIWDWAAVGGEGRASSSTSSASSAGAGAGSPTRSTLGLSTSPCLAVLTGHTREVTCICPVRSTPSSSTLLASASGDCSVRIWGLGAETGGWGTLCVFSGHTDEVTGVADAGGGFVASSSADGTLRLFDACAVTLSADGKA